MSLVLILTTTISVVNVVFLFLIYKMVTNKFAGYDQKFGELNIENELQNAFSEQMQDNAEFNEVSRELFERVKRKYGFKGSSSYHDLIIDLKKSTSIEKELRKNLIDFFERAAVLSYKDDAITANEKIELKRELKLILKRFQEK